MTIALLAFLLGIGIFTITGYKFYIQRKNRKALANHFQESKDQIMTANQAFEKMLDTKNGYFSNYQLTLWKYNVRDSYNRVREKSLFKVDLDKEYIKDIYKFRKYYQQSSEIRKAYNEEFIESELKEHSQFFDDIEGRSLDLQQRKAVVINEDNCLVVAGAGTGKTTTIAGKVAYLVSRYQVDPSEILLISFTAKSCEEMRERIKRKMSIDVDVRTFNKLGLDIIKEVEAENHKSVCGLSEKEWVEVINSFFTALIKDKAYLEKVILYFTEHLKPYKPDHKFESEGERIQHLKDQNLFGYKKIKKTGNDGTTYEYREKLKSQEEVEIANFLFLNDIEYSYEERYKYNTASREFGQYKPDFYLPNYQIYIEHFAIDKDGKVPAWFKGDSTHSATEKYNNSINWKRELHTEQGTLLVETYSWERREGKLLTNLKSNLESEGVEFHPKSADEIWKKIKSASEDEITNFIRLLYTFLTLFKSNNYSFNDIEKKIIQAGDLWDKERNQTFIEIFKPIHRKYESFLEDRQEIDFNDMINRAFDHVNSKRYVSHFKYIIIDEFQDISIGRYNLIKSLLKSNPACKLFCVGDDWQSIYRFTGSDIAIFTEFENYFSLNNILNHRRASELLFIETTYRFNNKLIELSSSFILKNQKQLNKNLKSHSEDNSQPYTVLYYNFDTISIDKTISDALNDIIVKEGNTSSSTVLILGRYNHDIKHLNKLRGFSKTYDNTTNRYKFQHAKAPHLSIEFLSVHSSKGLEADYVLLINCNSGKFGFPSEISDDPVLNLLLTSSDQYPNSEERRAFYVALTRCKKHIYFIVNSDAKSKFILELDNASETSTIKCPSCKTGSLQAKPGQNGYFYGCSNFPFCNYTENLSINKYLAYAPEMKDEELIKYYSIATEIDNSSKEAYFMRGLYNLKLKRFDEANYDFTQCINLDPNYLEAYRWRANLKYEMEDYVGSITDYSYLIEINSSDLLAYLGRAKAKNKLNNFESAIEDLNFIINKKPNEYYTYLVRGECLYRANEIFRAWQDWQKAENLGYAHLEVYLKNCGLIIKSTFTKEIKIKDSFSDQVSAIQYAIQKKQLIKFFYCNSESYQKKLSKMMTVFF